MLLALGLFHAGPQGTHAQAPAEQPDSRPVAKPRPVRPANLIASDIPLFEFRFRVAQNADKPAKGKFNYSLGFTRRQANSVDDQWSEWVSFTADDAASATAKHAYPNTYMRGWPLVLKTAVRGTGPKSIVEGQFKFVGDQTVHTIVGNLDGPTLGVLMYPDAESRLTFAGMAQYNREHFWSLLKDLPPADQHQTNPNQPQKFIIADRFIPGDSDSQALSEGINNLARIGFNTLADPSGKTHGNLMAKAGVPYTAGAVYSPPGYVFEFTEKPDKAGNPPPTLQSWAKQLAAPFKTSDVDINNVKLFALSDEPGWYYPTAYEDLKKNPAGLKRFQDYLMGQGLTPRDLGKPTWDDVLPIGQSQADTLEGRRLFYWTARFFPWDSARYFAMANSSLQQAFHPDLQVFTNWNFFAGRSYIPGAVANNSQKNSPDAGMGGHDWFEFAKQKAGSVLWTEDWFGDNRAYQWSYYSARLDAAARANNLTFGAYIVPRTAGDIPSGIIQKIVGFVGYGGKSIKYFVFGPEYNFPSNCYSFKPYLLPKMAQAHGMIARAEKLLYPGKRPEHQVGFLFPRSAQMWDITGPAPEPVERPDFAGLTIPGMNKRHPISDATNTNMTRSSVDYFVELYGLYMALQHQNIPATFIEEDELNAKKLASLKVLYITTPNLPAESVPVILDWVKQGGTLITTVGAGTADRYNQPMSALRTGLGLPNNEGDRVLVWDLQTSDRADIVNLDATTQVPAIARRISAPTDNPTTKAQPGPTFENGKGPARLIVQHAKGKVVHFPWLPGASYLRTGKDFDKKDKFPEAFSAPLGELITQPILQAIAHPHWAKLSHTMVETPTLFSDTGAAMTLLNWNNQPIEKLTVSARPGFTPSRIESVTHGELKPQIAADGEVTFQLPLDAADIVLIYR